MGISLAPDQQEDVVADPLKPKPVAPAVAPSLAPAAGPAAIAPRAAAPVGLAPAPQTPGTAGGAPPAALPSTVPPSAYGNMASTVPAPTVAPPSAPVDRVKLATDTFENLAGKRQSQFQADSRDNVRASAGMGQIASGGLRTREGDLRLARERDLDTLHKDLTLKATEGSIADAQTAYGQALAGSQQGLAEKIGLAGIENQKGSLDQSKAALALQEKLGLGGLSADQQRIAIAQKQQELDDKYRAGTMTLQERDAARADLALAQQNTMQNASLGLEKEKLGIAKGAQDIANQVALGQLSIAQATAALDEKVRTGQLTLAEKNQALAELSQKQGNENEQQRIGLAKDQLKQAGDQFGLSLAQQKELATLADKTQNRQLDISSAQGKNALLLELARIMGGPSGNVSPEFLAKVAAALGVSTGTTGTTTTTTGTTGTTGGTGTTGQGTGTRTTL